MVAKPSPETPLSALTLAYLAEKAGYPKGVFNVMPTTLANTPGLSEALCKHPLVKKVSFTGSVSDCRVTLVLRMMADRLVDSSGKDSLSALRG